MSQSKSQTPLSERIARLNLQGESPTNAPAASTVNAGSASVSPKATGAQGRISDKIKRFQKGTDGEAPLIPQGGSFGFAAPTLKPTSKSPNVASLGLGRAAVPLGVVSQRSTSSHSEIRSKQDYPKTTQYSEPSRPATPTTPTSVSASSQNNTLSPSFTATSIPKLSTPDTLDTMSVVSNSSMNVETGSIANTRSTSSSGSSGFNSPLSSPVIDAQVIDGEVPSIPSIPTLSTSTLSCDTQSRPKGPLETLRVSDRTASAASLSSMFVEAGSAVSHDDSLVLKELDFNDGAAVLANLDDLDTETAQLHRDKTEQAQRELEAYEREGQTPDQSLTIPYPTPTVSPHRKSSKSSLRRPSNSGDAVESYFESHNDNYAADEEELPKVKCSDCSIEISLMELADHTCGPSQILSQEPLAADKSVESLPKDSQEPSFDSNRSSMTSFATHENYEKRTSNASVKFNAKLNSFAAMKSSAKKVEPESDSNEDDYDHVMSDSSLPYIKQTSFDLPEDVQRTVYDDVSLNTHSPLFNDPTDSAVHLPPPSSKSRKRVSTASSLYLPLEDSDEEDYEGGMVTIVRSTRR